LIHSTMTTISSKEQQPCVYLVTSLQTTGDPCSPTVEGVYTTAEKAMENAQKIFAAKAATYSLVETSAGKKYEFSSKLKKTYDRCAKEENFLTLTERDPSCRVLLEILGDPHDYFEGVCVAINACTVNELEEFRVTVPLLHPGGSHASKESPPLCAPDAELFQGNPKMHIVMSYDPGEYGNEDAALLGIFTTKEKVMEAAKQELRHRGEEDDIESVDGCGMIYFNADDNFFCIAMDTVVLNEEAKEGKEQIELSDMASGIWMNPSISHDKEEDDDEEEEEKEVAEKENTAMTKIMKKQQPPKAQKLLAITPVRKEDATAHSTPTSETVAASVTPTPTKRVANAMAEPQPKKQKMYNAPQQKTCSLCVETKGKEHFSKSQWSKATNKCKVCVDKYLLSKQKIRL